MNLIEVAFIGIIILSTSALVIAVVDEEAENILRVSCDSGFKSPWSKTEVNILNSGQLFYTVDGPPNVVKFAKKNYWRLNE